MQEQSLSIQEAKYMGNYVLRVYFSSNEAKNIDFSKAFKKLKGYYAKYAEIENFEKFKVENGNLVWGENWDVIFPVWDIYTGKIN